MDPLPPVIQGLKHHVYHEEIFKRALRLMAVQMPQQFREHNGDVRPLIIGEYQPIFVRALVEAAENFTPGKLALAGEFGTHNALVEYAALGVIACRSLIKRMVMRKQEQLNSSGIVRQDLQFERAAIRAVDAKLVARPARYWQTAGLMCQRRWQNSVGNNQQVLELNFAGNTRNHRLTTL